MYCPSCKSEFRPEEKECAECGVPLVDELPPECELEWVDLKTVFVALDEMALMAAQSCLEAAGIPCFTTNNTQDLFVGRFAGYNILTGPQEIQVYPEDAERAIEILKSIEPPDEQE
jgi:hypothetical protein